MDNLWLYAGNLHETLPPHWAGMVLVVCSVLCGLVVGAEREVKHKAAGLRTVTLICVGSTIFTLASILIAGPSADPTRIAAQVVTGIGFLGAGAIIRDRGAILGLTTAATVWCVAAIGVLIGGGYAAAGLVLTAVVLLMLTLAQWIERLLQSRCRITNCRVVFRPQGGRSRVEILRALDQFRIPDSAWGIHAAGESQVLELRYCHYHRGHRAVLFELARIDGVVEINHEAAPRQTARDEPEPD